MITSRLCVSALLASSLLVACGNEPKTGIMPGIATGGYSAPTNADVSASYMGGFMARYDIPELDCPEDVKQSMKQARIKRLDRDMEVAANRTEFMAKFALMVAARKDPEAKRLWEDIKKRTKDAPSAQDVTSLVSLMSANQPKRTRLTKGQRQIQYSNALRNYTRAYKSLSVDTCRWTEMTRLIGTGHEAMAVVHGSHPTQGFECAVELQMEFIKGYPRPVNFNAYWVKSDAGDWQYFGKFPGVSVRPRRQFLDTRMLNDPERTILSKTAWESVADSFE